MIQKEISCQILLSPSIHEEEIRPIKNTLPASISVETREYLQATAGLPPEVIQLILFFATPFVQGFMEELGRDAYEHLAKALIDFLSKRKRETAIRLSFEGGGGKVEFSCETGDPEIAKTALEEIPNIIEKSRESGRYYFENKQKKWKKTSIDRSVAFKMQGVVATTDPVIINGKKKMLTVSALERLAREILGKPLLLEHRGTLIGRFVQSWVEDNKLFAEVEVFIPENELENKGVEAIRSSGLRGISMGSYGSD